MIDKLVGVIKCDTCYISSDEHEDGYLNEYQSRHYCPECLIEELEKDEVVQATNFEMEIEKQKLLKEVQKDEDADGRRDAERNQE